MMAARFFLGTCEAGLFPGINYYLSCWVSHSFPPIILLFIICWGPVTFSASETCLVALEPNINRDADAEIFQYRREELGIRAAIFFSAAAVSGSFGGLLAAAIGKMGGIGNKQGWAWIFILEGLATVLVGLLSFFLVFDFPDEATFLSGVDRERVIRRLKADQQSSAEHESFKMEYFWASIKDWKTYVYAAIYMFVNPPPGVPSGNLQTLISVYSRGADVPLYAFSLFLPSIVASLGYESTTAQLLSVPPYAAAAILTITVGCRFEADSFLISFTFANALKTSLIEHTKEASATSAPLSLE